MLIELQNKKTGQCFTGTKLQETDYGWLIQESAGWVWYDRQSYNLVREVVIS